MTKKEIIDNLGCGRYAHRGLHSKPEIPENSMHAFRLAVDEGFGIELDVHLTGDDKLAVIHDASLKRTAGVDLLIEDISLAQAQEYYLEKSQERIPDFEEFLKMVDGRIPLIIELKTEKGNTDALCSRMIKALEGYEGVYCIESFDPSVVKWLRNNAPWVVRGQLAGHLRRRKNSTVKRGHNFLLRTLLVNLMGGDPDFVAYKYEDIDSIWFKAYKGAKFTWTIKNYKDLKRAESLGIAGIFEQFNPKDYE